MPVSDDEFSKGRVDFYTRLRPAIIEDLKDRTGGYSSSEILDHLSSSHYKPDDVTTYREITKIRNDEQWIDLDNKQLDVLEAVLNKMYDDGELEREKIKIGSRTNNMKVYKSDVGGEVEEEVEYDTTAQWFYRYPSKPAVLQNT